MRLAWVPTPHKDGRFLLTSEMASSADRETLLWIARSSPFRRTSGRAHGSFV